MYNGKCKKRSAKTITLMVSLLLLIGIAVSGTIAFLIDNSGPLTNQFKPSMVTATVQETLDGKTKSNVYIQNTGDTGAWIRAYVIVSWQDKDGNVYGQQPITNSGCEHSDSCGCDYEIIWGSDSLWVKGSDGFYYYTLPVAAGENTSKLIESCTSRKAITVGSGENAVAYYLTVEIVSSAIQSNPAEVFEVWTSSGLTVKTKDNNGNVLAPEDWQLSQGVQG